MERLENDLHRLYPLVAPHPQPLGLVYMEERLDHWPHLYMQVGDPWAHMRPDVKHL
jgi:hypothetical protein